MAFSSRCCGSASRLPEASDRPGQRRWHRRARSASPGSNACARRCPGGRAPAIGERQESTCRWRHSGTCMDAADARRHRQQRKWCPWWIRLPSCRPKCDCGPALRLPWHAAVCSMKSHCRATKSFRVTGNLKKPPMPRRPFCRSRTSNSSLSSVRPYTGPVPIGAIGRHWRWRDGDRNSSRSFYFANHCFAPPSRPSRAS